MPQVPDSMGSELVEESTSTDELLQAAATDIAALRGAIVALTAKLDADAGVTDTNYAATIDPPAAELTPRP